MEPDLVASVQESDITLLKSSEDIMEVAISVVLPRLLPLQIEIMVSGLINANPIVDIKDPEHPYSLEELKVISEDAIEVDNERSYVRVTFTPTVEHCSMATVIGLCLRVKLMRSLPSHYKMDIRVAPGTHATEAAVNKQLNDKERVAAALENPNLLDMVDECLAPSYA
ncbi:hypothetical protein V6N11_069640 [Hibiscus sabdariffa]|uniref:MIP18 family-like domain-containing protein n=1 Tax=Hibiscus sabdariffa TaxID=183260 RepID=A0ABR2Q3D3_9ROSI